MRVARVRRTDATIRIGAEGDWLRFVRAPVRPRGVILHGPLTVVLGTGGWEVWDGKGFQPWVEGMETLEIEPTDEAGRLHLGERQYPGQLRLITRPDVGPTAFDVINHVAMERYLPGVVAREIFHHWHPATQAAQAIAARSFAASEHAYFGSRRHFDLSDNQASQVYAGVVEAPRAHAAVAETRGQMLAWGGRLVPGYYCACCGGTAASAVDVIGPHPFNTAPPLAGRASSDICAEAPLFDWTLHRPVDELSRRLAAYGRSRGEATLEALVAVRGIEAIEHNAHGRPTRYAVRGDETGHAEVSAEDLRRALDHRVRGLEPADPRLYSSFFTASIAEGTCVIDGRGHGHGAGLCQYGAEALARAGENATGILRWYYPGVELALAYL